MSITPEAVKWSQIDDLKPHPKNPNKHTPEQIQRLSEIIKYQGFRVPIIVSNLSGFIVAGHGRLEAAKAAGLTKVPVIFQDFADEDQEYAFIVSDNAIGEWSTLDFSLINMEIESLGPDLNIELLGIQNFKLDPSEIDVNKEWAGMPEFTQDDKTSYRSVIVHFNNDQDVNDFFGLINQSHTPKTKSIWHPKQINMDTESKRYE